MKSGANDNTEDSSQIRHSEFVHIVVANENKIYFSEQNPRFKVPVIIIATNIARL